MKYLQRVVWAKGMLLTPQHFQALSNLNEDTLQFRFTASNFANWGLAELKFDLEVLAKGEISVMRLSGILPDGSLIDCPNVDPAPPVRPFATHFPANADLIDVFLAVPARLDGRNVAMEPGNTENSVENLRFLARTRDVRDENGLDEDRPVQFAQRNLIILFGSQAKEGYVRLRIGQVRRTSTGFELNPDFIPPLLSIAASGSLMDLIKRQVEILGQKSQALSNSRRQRGGAASFNLNEAQSLWLLQTVNSYLPELAHVWNTRHGHPEPVYVSMLRVAGALAVLALDEDIRSFPQYDHDNLGLCFFALDARVRSLLEKALPTKCISVPLKQSQRIWTGTFGDDSWLTGTQLYLAIAANMGVDDIIRKVPPLVRVGPPDEIETMIRYATPGLTLRHLNPPGAIPFRVENQYFGINQTGRLWEGIVKSRLISVFLPSELAGAKPELYVLLP